jgi:GTPase
VEKEEINEQGEFLLSIRLEKTEWLKLVKRFTQLTPFNPIQPDEN